MRGRLRNVAGHAELQWDVSAYRARLRASTSMPIRRPSPRRSLTRISTER
ncbi:MAG: hypothetical protein WAQ08_08460 [Aquabacterium sp.]